MQGEVSSGCPKGLAMLNFKKGSILNFTFETCLTRIFAVSENASASFRMPALHNMEFSLLPEIITSQDVA
jgi:hypothetical protein